MQAAKLLPEPVSSGRILQVDDVRNVTTVQTFITQCFAERYGASIQVYACHLIALVDQKTRLRAAVGYQTADEGSLFLEQYLDQPIEQVLFECSRQSVSRQQILEVGNLASRSGGWTRQLILALAYFYCHQGFEWIVMTATPQVLNSFHRLGVGLELMPLAAADPRRLQGDASLWGSYYDEQPVVVAGRLRKGLRRLLANPKSRTQLWTQGYLPSDREVSIVG